MRVDKKAKIWYINNSFLESPTPKTVISDRAEKAVSHAETPSLGDLIELFYQEFLALFGDEDLASVAAAASINELLANQKGQLDDVEVAA